MPAKLSVLSYRVLGGLALTVLACHAQPAPAPSHASLRAGLLAADDQLAAALAGGEALWPWLAEDAADLRPGAALITSRDVARTREPALRVRLHRVAGDVSEDGKLGYSFGWLEQVVRTPDSPSFGKYLAAWQRSDARWELSAWVDLPAKQPPRPPPAGAAILAGSHGVAQPGDPGALRDQAIAADTAFAALSAHKGYTVAFPGNAAPDAVIIGAGDLAWGAAGVTQAFAGWTPAEALEWTPRLGRAAASGDLAFTVGEAVFSTTKAGAIDRRYTKYLTIWVHQADRGWQFLLDAGNDRPGP